MAERDEASAGRQVLGRFRSRIGGANSGTMAEVKSTFKADLSEFKKVHGEVKALKTDVGDLRKEMDKLVSSTNRVASAIGGLRAGKGASAGTGYLPPAVNTSPVTPTPQAAGTAPAASGGGRGGFGGIGLGGNRGLANAAGGVGPLVALEAGQMIATVTSGMDNRFDRGMAYAMNADRRSVVAQQMYGISSAQVREQRAAIANYRLGPDGPNAFMDFQRTTGFSLGTQMNSSVAGLRALSGYSKSTTDVLGDIQANLNPAVANRMYSTMGISPMKPGGRELADPMELQRQIIRRLGMSENKGLVETSFAPGSAMRDRMRSMGLTEEMIQDTLQYAQSNISYREKGGKGFYDPSKESDRKLMGIEENLATKAEDTDRLRTQREEKFMGDQYKAMVSVEVNTGRMVELLTNMEGMFAEAIGLRAKTRNWTRIAGRASQVVGAGLIASGVGTGVGIAMVVGGTAAAGDPPESDGGGSGVSGATGVSQYSDSSKDGSIMVPFGYGGGRKSLNDVKNSGTFKGMNPKMKERMLAMMRANPNLGVGGGMRDSKEQERMFLDRYRPTDKKTDVFWNGKYWTRVKGAPAAPPGKSMHEIGLAADMVGDIDWMLANASKFGLKHFANVNNEPWHIQPAELPNSRSKYESGGAQWGSDGGHDPDASFGPNQQGGPVTGAEDSSAHAGGFQNNGHDLMAAQGMSVADILGGGDRVTGTASSMGMAMGWGRRGTTAGTSGMATTIGSGAGVPSTGQLTGEQVAQFAYQAGFRGDDLARVVAIAKRESSWNPGALNPNAKTKDYSLGLMQINMLGNLEAERLKLFGLSSKDQLYDPLTNMKAAYALYQNRGGKLTDWGGYKGKSDTYNTDVSEAMAIVKNAGLYSGDPTIDMARHAPMAHGGSSGGSVNIRTSPVQITVAPQITFQGTPSSPDLRAMAHEVVKLIEAEVKTLEMRGA
jgi:hypothetical protein